MSLRDFVFQFVCRYQAEKATHMMSAVKDKRLSRDKKEKIRRTEGEGETQTL